MIAHTQDAGRLVESGTTSSITHTPSLQNVSSKPPDKSTSSDMLATPGDHARQAWRAPLVILLTLLAGLICALAHHLTNNYLSGRDVSDTTIPQAWVLRLQTIFAFVVKMFLTISVGAAFVQRQWWIFQRQQFRIYEIDAITTVLGDLFAFSTVSAWRKAPLLALAALISWTVPFATIISPGSLSVGLNEAQYTIRHIVPQLSFNNSTSFTQSTAFGSATQGTSIGNFIATAGLWQVALSVAVSGQMASLAMSYRNMTYSYQFPGPALKCTTIQNVTEFTSILKETSRGNLTCANYTSWAGDGEIAFDRTAGDWYSREGASIYVARGTKSCADYGGQPATSENAYVNECRLHYALYDMTFQFRFPEQNLTLLKLDFGAPVNINNTLASEITDWTPIAYAGIMEAFGRLLVGSITRPSPSPYSIQGQIVNATSVNILHIDWSEAETARIGLEQLFQNITLSLLSRSSFIKNSTQAEPIPITVFNFVNIYRYDRTGLFLAYGLALLGTLLCAIMGLHATWANKGSYRNTFSTFLRSSDNDELRSLLDSSDDGRDPLPKQLGCVQLTMHSRT